jgi:hypothetical protein
MTTAGTMQQKDPILDNDNPALWDLVIEDFKRIFCVNDGSVVSMMNARNHFGIGKYGIALKAYNGRSFAIDAIQEALDLCVYLRGLWEEEKNSPAGQDIHKLYTESLVIVYKLHKLIREPL